ncbi:unnamed protein product [Trichogramma brassicae]|uniref:SCP domain-containing protein n=1 Tax=Trichogramma brassicae TaxID=86971 RepID=A0A6H5J0X2_9HYME|nr:unnamed protein product [Trichogramma brassicae]
MRVSTDASLFVYRLTPAYLANPLWNARRNDRLCVACLSLPLLCTRDRCIYEREDVLQKLSKSGTSLPYLTSSSAVRFKMLPTPSAWLLPLFSKRIILFTRSLTLQERTSCLGDNEHPRRSNWVTEQEKYIIVQLHNELRQKVARGEEQRGNPGPQPPALAMPNLQKRPHNKCPNLINAGLTFDEKKRILKQHNALRYRVAKGLEKAGSPGPQPRAVNMRLLILYTSSGRYIGVRTSFVNLSYRAALRSLWSWSASSLRGVSNSKYSARYCTRVSLCTTTSTTRHRRSARERGISPYQSNMKPSRLENALDQCARRQPMYISPGEPVYLAAQSGVRVAQHALISIYAWA